MNEEQKKWAGRYIRALRKYLNEDATSGLQSALRLGSQAVDLDLETLALARIHENARAKLVVPDNAPPTKARRTKRARAFFAKTMIPLEKKHGVEHPADMRVKKLIVELDRRTARLAATNQRLKMRCAERRSAQEALGKSDERYAELLNDSRELEERLRQIAHQMLSSHEQEKKEIREVLRDEIAQSLLGIHVQLLAARAAIGANAALFGKDVASMHRQVVQSFKLLDKYTHELGRSHET